MHDGCWYHRPHRIPARARPHRVGRMEGVVVRDVAWYRERDAFVAGYNRGVLVAGTAVLGLLLLLKWCFP